MSFKRAIQTFIKDPLPTERYEEVVPGINIIDGIVKVENPLRSPVRGHNCAGYHYQSYLVLNSPRNPQPQVQKIREAEVYAPFELQMDGGAVQVEWVRKSDFTRDTHQELQRHYGPTFQGLEDLVLPGAKVRVKGKMRLIEGRKVLKMTVISVLEKQVVQKGVVGDRKARKRRQK